MKPFPAWCYDLTPPDDRGAGLWEGIWVESAEGEPRAGSVGDLLDLDPAWQAELLVGALPFRVARVRMGRFRPILGWCLLVATLVPPERPGGRWRAVPTRRLPEAILLRLWTGGEVEVVRGGLILARGAAGVLARLDPHGRIRLGTIEIVWTPPGPPIVRRGIQL